jgi:hypothetical protein
MVQEAALKQTDEGLVLDGHGWFVMNARDARWVRRPGRGHNAPITTDSKSSFHSDDSAAPPRSLAT